MSDDDIKKAVTAKALDMAKLWGDKYILRQGVILWRHFDCEGWTIDRTAYAGTTHMILRLETDLPASNNQWWMAAKLMDVPTT